MDRLPRQMNKPLLAILYRNLVGVLVVSILISFTSSDRVSDVGVQRLPRLVLAAAEILCFNCFPSILTYCIFVFVPRSDENPPGVGVIIWYPPFPICLSTRR